MQNAINFFPSSVFIILLCVDPEGMFPHARKSANNFSSVDDDRTLRRDNK